MVGRRRNGSTWAIAFSCLVASASCVQLLGNDFSIDEGGGGEGGNGPGPTTGGSGGGGGAIQAGPLSCSFSHARELTSLAALPGLGRIQLAWGSHNLRAFIPSYDASSASVAVVSIDEANSWVAIVPGYEAPQASRVGGTTVGALVARQDTSGAHAIDYVRIDDSDDQLANLSIVPLVEGLATVSSLEARFDRVPGTNEDLALIVTHRPSTTSPFLARFAYVAPNQAPVATVIFDDSSTYPAGTTLGDGDYEPSAFLRDGGGNNHAIFRNMFDGANYVRHFVFPDSVTGTVAPVVLEPASGAPILLGMLRRADGRFAVSYAELGVQDAALRIGSIDEGELTTHTASSLPLAGSLQIAGVFSEVALVTTEESLVIVGPRVDRATDFQVVIGHSSATIRANEAVPLPEGVMPGDAVVGRIAAVANGSVFDTAFGGDLLLVWHAEIPGDSTRIYFGIMTCGAN
jgi:hypothetical protein